MPTANKCDQPATTKTRPWNVWHQLDGFKVKAAAWPAARTIIHRGGIGLSCDDQARRTNRKSRIGE